MLISASTSLTWKVCVRLPLLRVSAAHQLVVHNMATAALYPVAVVEDPAAAELAAPAGVRNRSTAAVAQPHRHPPVGRVRAAGLVCNGKDSQSESPGVQWMKAYLHLH